jgi:uncharacterized protein (TIGR03083 family)
MTKLDDEGASARAAFLAISDTFVDVVQRVPNDRWNDVALGEWSMRSLVGHGARAMLTVTQYLDAGASAVETNSPVAYFQRAMGSAGDPAGIAARGVQAGEALGADPKAAVREIRERAVARLTVASDDDLVGLPWGGMTLGQYLPTRVFELTIHTLDIAVALGIEGEIALPPQAVAVTAELIGGLTALQGKAAEMLLAVTGRRSLADGFSVI